MEVHVFHLSGPNYWLTAFEQINARKRTIDALNVLFIGRLMTIMARVIKTDVNNFDRTINAALILQLMVSEKLSI
jgi:hypothetical protein